MATVVTQGGDYIASGGGTVRRWEPASYILQAGETGFLGFPSLADLQALGLQGRQVRSLPLIYNDLVALTNTQKTNIWTDLSSGSPPKILNYTGGNSGAIWALHWAATNTSLPAASVTDAKLHAAAMYVQDHVSYLVNPTFDPTINVAGDQLQ